MTDTAAARAQAAIDGSEALSAARLGDDTLAVAWALKDACYAAWSSAPQRSGRAAAVLAALAETTDERTAPALRAELSAVASWTQGIAAITEGKLADARAYLETAAETFRTLGQNDRAAQTRVPTIMVLAMLGEYPAAIACAEQARTEFVALGDRQSAGKVSVNLGALHERRGAYHDAVRESRAAAVLFARVGDREHSIMADINAANGLSSLGDFDEAQRIYARARMRAETHGFPVLVALAIESAALIDLVLGRYRAALTGLEEALRRYAEIGTPLQVATAEKQLGDAYLELRLFPEALTRFDDAAKRFAELEMPDERAWALLQAGRTHALRGALDAAAPLVEDAAAAFAEHGIDVGVAMAELARAELAFGAGDDRNAQRAHEHAERARAWFAENGLREAELRAALLVAEAAAALDPNTNDTRAFETILRDAREAGLVALEVRALACVGAAAIAAGAHDTARAQLEHAIALLEEQRDALPGTDLRSALANEHLAPYAARLRLARVEAARQPSAAANEDVLRQIDRVRARALDDATRLREAASDDDDTGRVLRERLQWLYRRIARAEEQGEATATLQAESRERERALLEHARRQRIAAPAAPAAHAAYALLDVGALRARLTPHEALVAYGLLDGHAFACVATRDGVQVVDLPTPWSGIATALEAARFQFDALRDGAAHLVRRLPELTHRSTQRLERLHDMLWAPLAPMIEGLRDVYVVPTAELGWVPFSALNDGEAPLDARLTLAVLPSARALLALPAAPRARRPEVLVVGESSRLPHAREEAMRVAGYFPGAACVLDDDATIARLLEDAPRADLIHFACHAEFRGDNPLFSSLRLADGALTAERIEQLRLPGSLVVLSACETAASAGADGAEPIGLVRAFLLAGAARVVASAWPVDDAVTAEFMAAFYGALGASTSAADALRQARSVVRERHPHPNFWAGFTIYGGR